MKNSHLSTANRLQSEKQPSHYIDYSASPKVSELGDIGNATLYFRNPSADDNILGTR